MSKDYTSASQQRVLKVLEALFEDVIAGVSPTALAHAAGCSPSAITRDLANLRQAGFAIKDERTGLWRLTPRIPRKAVLIWATVARHSAELEAAKRNYPTPTDAAEGA